MVIFGKLLSAVYEAPRINARQKQNIPDEKRRITKIRQPGLCLAKIKVSWVASLNIVRVERYKDSPNHTHTLLEVDRIKRPEV